MTKRITFPPKPPAAPGVDAWVAERAAEPTATRPPPAAPTTRMRKLTVDVPDDLYRRVRVGLAAEDRHLTGLIREFLAARFPER